MMIKVEAIVREEVFEDVKEALNAIDVNGITVSQVMGCGAQRGYKKRVRIRHLMVWIHKSQKQTSYVIMDSSVISRQR